MKPLPTKKTLFVKTQAVEENFPKIEFAKIAAIDPDEKKKKKEEQEEVKEAGIYTPERSKLDTVSPVEQFKALATSLLELSTPLIKNIKLQTELGITKTNFLVQTKTLGEVEIHLTMYDTDPYSFHIKILGNTRVQELSIKHQRLLTTQIKESLPKIKLHIAPPALRKRDRFKVKGKKSVEKRTGSWYGAINGGKNKE